MPPPLPPPLIKTLVVCFLILKKDFTLHRQTKLLALLGGSEHLGSYRSLIITCIIHSSSPRWNILAREPRGGMLLLFCSVSDTPTYRSESITGVYLLNSIDGAVELHLKSLSSTAVQCFTGWEGRNNRLLGETMEILWLWWKEKRSLCFPVFQALTACPLLQFNTYACSIFSSRNTHCYCFNAITKKNKHTSTRFRCCYCLAAICPAN